MHPGPASHPGGDGGLPPGLPGHGRSAPPPPPPGPPPPPAPGSFGAPARPFGSPAAVSPAPAPPSAPGLANDGNYRPPPFGAGPPGGEPPKPPYATLRGVGAFLCLLLTVLLTVPAVTASWLKDELISSSGFSDNATSLIKEPAIRDEIQNEISQEIMGRSGVPQSARDLVVSSVGTVMDTEEFQRVWETGVTAAHNAVVGTLLGKDTEYVQQSEGELTIQVQTPLDPLFAELTKAGVEVDRDQIPTELSIPLADIPTSGPAQDALRGIDDAGWILPILAIALLLVGVGIAVHRLRALAITAMGTLVMGGVLLVVANLARSPVVDEASKGSDLSSEATGAVYDVFTDTLVTDAWIVIVISIVMLAGTAITGAVLRNRRASV